MNTRQIAAEYRLAHWTQAIKERIASGEKIKDFCQRIGINRNTYFYWQQRIRKRACEKLAEIQGFGKQSEMTVSSFTEIKVSEPLALPAASGQVLVEYRGVPITFDASYPPDQLASFIRSLTLP